MGAQGVIKFPHIILRLGSGKKYVTHPHIENNYFNYQIFSVVCDTVNYSIGKHLNFLSECIEPLESIVKLCVLLVCDLYGLNIIINQKLAVNFVA